MAVGPPLKHVAGAVEVDVQEGTGMGVSQAIPQFGAAETRAMRPARMIGICIVYVCVIDIRT